MHTTARSCCLIVMLAGCAAPSPTVVGAAEAAAASPPAPSLAAVSIPYLDLDADAARQVVVDKEDGQYLGHPSTLLLEDGRTILCVYPKGHGRGAIVYKRSTDGGLTWSDRLPTPDSWATSKEVPVLTRTVDAAGTKRIVMFSGLYPARTAISEDDGATWSELAPIGDWGGIVVMGDVIPLNTGAGHYMAMFHDDGRFIAADARQQKPVRFTLYKTFSRDGGVTWSEPATVWSGTDMHLCEPGFVRSPDGKQIAVLLRENARRATSQVIFSDDEGATFTDPRPLPLSLSGDRHQAVYAPDGRLFISFRSNPPKGADPPGRGSWVAWVGTYDDIVRAAEGRYLVRLRRNYKDYDCAYPGVEMLPDGTIVATTYGHWDSRDKPPYILSVRLKLAELDALAKQPPAPAAE